MSAVVHLVLGPPGTDRLGRLYREFRIASRELGAALVLVPTRRHADQVRASLTTMLAPQVWDFQSFADELVRVHEPAFRPHSDAERRILLDSVLSDLRTKDLPYFADVADTRGFVHMAAGYLEEMKDAAIELRQLFKVSGGRKQPEQNRHLQATRTLERYQRRLARLNRFDPPDRLGRAAGLWQKERRQPFDRVRSVFVAGFTSFTHYQRHLLEALRDTVDHIWIELPDGEGKMFAEPRAVREWLTKSSLLDPDPNVEIEQIDSLKPSPAVHLIEAAGELGEARFVARHVRALLKKGLKPERILVVARRFASAEIDLFCEVFDEYAIPHDAEGADTLSRAPAVAFLLRALRLAVEDWPFAHLTAVLRSAFFRPDWPEVQADPDVPAQAEALLRMLGETRGRETYLKAVDLWEHTPPEPLEDEHAEESLRQHKQRLARRCRPFLQRFFTAWDHLKLSGSATTVVEQLKAFASDIGLSQTAAPNDGLERFWKELDHWVESESATRTRKLLRPERFLHVLTAISSSPCRARTPRAGVQLLSADFAAGLDCDGLFLVGLGEGSWPNLSAPVSLLDDPERQRLHRAGFALADPAARLTSEQLLFHTLLATPRQELVLSYPAMDARGQKLLPSSFLREYLACAGEIPTTKQHMLLDGYFDREPLSAAELRVQCARGNSIATLRDEELRDNLTRAAEVARARFQALEFTPFDGLLRLPAVTAELAKRFGPDRVFSPTALEAYVACPFRFLLQHVLRLTPLEDPAEEVEHTRRGSAFHRALARFHLRLNEIQPEVLGGAELPPSVTDELVAQIGKAVDEYAQRAPSRASAELWRLEGKRLERAARRYRDHWQEYRSPWREKNATPSPHRFEVDFGVQGPNSAESLVIVVGDVEVRIGGRIDRIDLTEVEDATGFWVIDYKTGRATNYSAAQVERFEKLQLPLYALAVERVLLKDRPARPLGLAYWLVTDTGHKPMLPGGRKSQSWLADPDVWSKFREQLESWVATLVSHIRAGDFPLAPRSEHCTDTCPHGPICRIAQSRNTGKEFALELPVVEK